MSLRFSLRATVAVGLLASVAFPLLGQSLAVRSSANYGETVSPGSAATLFGDGFADSAAVGALDRAGRLPTRLAGVEVLLDGRAARLAYVSAGQINLVVPAHTAEGVVAVEVLHDEQTVAQGTATVAGSAPGLFSADGSGAGTGLILNEATYARGPFAAQTPEIPGCDKRSRLTLLATGVRQAAETTATVEDASGGTRTVEVEAAAASEQYPGVDEVRIVAPQDVGGELSVRLTADGRESNAVSFSLDPSDVPPPDCAALGEAYVYNTVSDLLAGDLWDVASPDQVFTDLASAQAISQGDWPVNGVGTTALEARNGEVIAAGSAGAPELVWADPHFPPTVRTLSDEPIPFVGVAAGNPASAISAEADPGRPIHEQILELAREHNLAFASIRVEGRFAPVSYSVAHNLLKQGTPLTDPTVDKAPFQLFFTADASAEWQLSGFYAAAANIQELVSVRGAPVHLHGFQLDRSRAGHVGSATVENAVIRLYPLAAPKVMESDLTVRNVSLADGQVSLEVLNQGAGTVTRTTVQGRSADAVVFQAELVDLVSGQAQTVSVQVGDLSRELVLEVDPFNDVLESDEFNNVEAVPTP